MSDANSPTKRPLIAAFSRDALAESGEFLNNAIVAGDKTVVPGYSDLRFAADEALRKGRKPPRLSHRYQWVTITSPTGTPDNRKVADFTAKGYRRVHKDDLSGLGIEVPPAAIVTADGYFRVGDTELFVCDAAHAARNEATWRSAIESRTADAATSQDLKQEGSRQARRGEELTWSNTELTEKPLG